MLAYLPRVVLAEVLEARALEHHLRRRRQVVFAEGVGAHLQASATTSAYFARHDAGSCSLHLIFLVSRMPGCTLAHTNSHLGQASCCPTRQSDAQHGSARAMFPDKFKTRRYRVRVQGGLRAWQRKSRPPAAPVPRPHSPQLWCGHAQRPLWLVTSCAQHAPR